MSTSVVFGKKYIIFTSASESLSKKFNGWIFNGELSFMIKLEPEDKQPNKQFVNTNEQAVLDKWKSLAPKPLTGTIIPIGEELESLLAEISPLLGLIG